MDLTKIIQVEFKQSDSRVTHADHVFGEMYSFLDELTDNYKEETGRELDKTRIKEELIVWSVGGMYGNAMDAIIAKYNTLPGDIDYVGEINIELSAREGEFRAQVSDNGTGFHGIGGTSPAYLVDLVFTKPIITQKSGHSGTHLYKIARKIENLGGSYGLENHGKNKGATFWYEVPLEKLEIH